MWKHYKKHLLIKQAALLTLLAIYLLVTANWGQAIALFVVIQLAFFMGARWAARITQRAALVDQAPLRSKSGL